MAAPGAPSFSPRSDQVRRRLCCSRVLSVLRRPAFRLERASLELYVDFIRGGMRKGYRLFLASFVTVCCSTVPFNFEVLHGSDVPMTLFSNTSDFIKVNIVWPATRFPICRSAGRPCAHSNSIVSFAQDAKITTSPGPGCADVAF